MWRCDYCRAPFEDRDLPHLFKPVIIKGKPQKVVFLIMEVNDPNRTPLPTLIRGVEKVRAEWALICTAHNLLKLANPA